MREITVKLYQFDELSTGAKEKAREWYRRASEGDNFWSERILQEDAPAILAHLGYCKPNIFYSGFWSQGDGACFAGTWYARDCKPDALKAHAPEDTELARIADALAVLIAKHPDMSASITHIGHYYHAMSTAFDIEFADCDDYEANEATLEPAREEFKELSRDLMRWIYKFLETEYEYQNADEQIDDNIRCNEYEFTAGGKRA